MKIVVLAGGIGQRLWPLSRKKQPKQVQPVIGNSTLLQKTIKRVKQSLSVSDIFIVTGQEFLPLIKKQLPHLAKKNLIIEPARRGTAPAIGLAAYLIAKKNPKETIITVPSDHYVRPEKSFNDHLKKLSKIVEYNPSAVCLMGIKPAYPETGYGYIKTGKTITLPNKIRVKKVERFVEKPALSKAGRMVSSGSYLWNPSYCAWQVGRIMQLFSRFIPDTHKKLLQTVSGNTAAFRKIKSQSIDYAVLERLREEFYVLPADFSWADVGHWASVQEIQASNTSQNVTLGIHNLIDTKGSLVYNYTERMLATIGISDLVVVQTEHGTLVCKKDKAQDVKSLVKLLERNKNYRKYL